MPQVKPEIETFAKIKVVGIGGSGSSAVDRMVRSGIKGVEFVIMNTDVQALHHNSANHKLHIGKTVTRGLGAGMDPEMGKRSAEEAQNEIREILKDTDMIFLTCGLGGGTGSGASPVVAAIAKDLGILTVAVVTKPFIFEGPQRTSIAERAHRELSKNVDTIITIPNDRILKIIDKKTSLVEAFKIVDDVLRQGVQGISEIITIPQLINVDFADVKTIMKSAGSALMGIGISKGENRAIDAAKAAISSPLLDVSIDGARGILFTITASNTLGMQEVSDAAQLITSSAGENVKVIFGANIDESLGEDLRITVVATGFDRGEAVDDASGDEKEVDDDRPPRPIRSPIAETRRFASSIFSSEKKNIEPAVSSQAVEDRVDQNSSPKKQSEEISPAPRQNFVSRPVSVSPQVPSQSPRPINNPPPSSRPILPVSPSVDDIEEIESQIPAFLRRKMDS
ncbi:MAG TPA: cell division protein FtsZ [Candidatus Magasanikbacteria bacterium]|nr:cell division protein FtsZ [Candidatus Magasanikbacteria bacterium]